ncbi:hypothetical protein [Alkaliphilus peptidifermentans]|uniref:Uncharacterized protein n=1 Tax=Alkaliphilus peptidifermentans DSM 18978 TaxID=1120976 RepID=A0A1G5L138_9FIRM|nr:hypothetical protein [Alkaliphilus peptidifermentans]SCZ06020.1 hypothetical protein SAMN03080606_03922 [Alkaliphilus peptidifermentans DSM 18978]
MLLNYIIGFIVPWIISIKYIMKNLNIFIVIAPIGTVFAYTINTWAYHSHYWKVSPERFNYYSTLPYDLGLYPVYACLMIVFIKNKKANPYFIVLIASIIITFLEYIALMMDIVIYTNGWNIFFTFISYLLPLLLVYWYYLLAIHRNILKNI